MSDGTSPRNSVRIKVETDQSVRRIVHRHRNGNGLCRISTELAQRCLSDDATRPERGRRNTGNEDDCRSPGSSCDDDAQPRQRERRPQSAWNGRSGRRPQFTLSDMDATGGEDDELYDDERWMRDTTRRKWKRAGSCGNIASTITSTTPKRTPQLGPSRIPVRTDRHHPTSTTDHVDSVPRRHSVCLMTNHKSTIALSDLSRDVIDENSSESFSGRRTKPAQPKAGLTTSSSEHSLTDARKRALARLAGSQLPPIDSDEISARRLPRKLDPIFSRTFVYDEDDKRVMFTCG